MQYILPPSTPHKRPAHVQNDVNQSQTKNHFLEIIK